MSPAADRIVIARGENDLLFDESGRAYIDLFSANGTAWLGHSHAGIAAAVQAQLGQIWNTGALANRVRDEATRAVEAWFPKSHHLAGFFSTGMEAAEFSLRMARIATGRPKVVAFEHAMHGKSLATAALAWENDWNLHTHDLVRLPFVDAKDEDVILDAARSTLAERDVAALLVEPILGSYGGYHATPDFYGSLQSLCNESGALLIFDEILTGFGRTGAPFCFADFGVAPDVILIGKALGNGFPVSGVIVDRRLEIEPRMLPGSTFAGNPLASAAVLATLRELESINWAERVVAIAETIERRLGPLRELGLSLRGRGAMHVLELDPAMDVSRFLQDVYAAGVAVGNAGRFVRLLPAVTISPERLDAACAVIASAVERQLSRPVVAERD